VIIVTGTGRSGTSAVARVLHESGINMGRNFAGPGPHNATGYYEDLDVAAVNDKIYADCGLTPSNSLPARALRRLQRLFGVNGRPPSDTYVTRAAVLKAATRHTREMQDLVAQVPSPGGWKGTHMCWTLEAWLPLLPAKPQIVLCLRTPDAVAGSALAYFGLTADDAREWAIELWSNQYQRLIEVIEEYQLDTITIEYDELIANTAATIERLSRFVGQPLDLKYVEPVLRHHTAEVPERLAGLYERVKQLSKDAGPKVASAT
jgi:hypothetical protein